MTDQTPCFFTHVLLLKYSSFRPVHAALLEKADLLPGCIIPYMDNKVGNEKFR